MTGNSDLTRLGKSCRQFGHKRILASGLLTRVLSVSPTITGLQFRRADLASEVTDETDEDETVRQLR